MIKEWIRSYKNSLFEVDSKNLTSGSKVSLLFFILIVFIIVGSGINMQVSYVDYPSKKFGYTCISMVDKESDITKFQNRDIKKDLYGTYFPHKSWQLSDFKYDHHQQSEYDILRQYGTHKLCQTMGTRYLDVANDERYRERLIEYNALQQSLSSMNASVALKEKEYGIMLLEDIANQPDDLSILSSSSDKVKQNIIDLQNKITKVKNHIHLLNDLTTLGTFNTFENYLKSNGSEIKRLYAEALRYYKLHYTLNIFIFLLPTWLIFYVAYRLFKRKERHILAHLSVHVANVTALYIVFYLLSLIYDIMPKVFFTRLVAFFSHYNLTIVLNLLAILVFMAIFGLFIYRIQKNRSTDLERESDAANQKIITARITAGLCSSCGLKTESGDRHCGRCGHALLRRCSSCHTKTHIDDIYCRSCGERVGDTL